MKSLTHFKRNILYKLACLIASIFCFCFSCISCNDLVDIAPPTNTIVTEQAFRDSSNAVAAVNGIYSDLAQNKLTTLRFGNGAVGIYCSVSADDYIPFNSSIDFTQLYTNTLLSDNSLISIFWNQAYQSLYRINGCIEGVEESAGLSESLKGRLLGEAKFLRAFHYFYLINLFGDAPLVTTTNWRETFQLSRSAVPELYNLIIEDLKYAKENLPENYLFSANERVRPIKWAASSLLARVYLYLKDWEGAEKEASLVISRSDQFQLTSLENVFLKNNTEAILQWHQNSAFNPYNVTVEGFNLVPRSGRAPTFFLTDDLMSFFEAGDKRKEVWTKSYTYRGTEYIIPYKYKLGATQMVPNANPEEYFNILRLAEIVLIRSEARMEKGDVEGSRSDLNVIRRRANLNDFESNDLTKLRAAILKEKRIELFGEWGHRWLDLKRLGIINDVLSPIKVTWKPYQQWYPIPFNEMQKNVSLIQNEGYAY